MNDITEPATMTSFDSQDFVGQLIQASTRYTTTLQEYCYLAMQPTLSAADEDYLANILAQATRDPLLSFWIDEADHFIAHQLGLIDEAFIAQQQGKLRRAISQTWIDTLWSNLQNRTKALQAYLQRLGFYQGAIDGIEGPFTQAAIRAWQQQGSDDMGLVGS
ncbi:hypothetical protein XM38_030270 [Halomicronema hongdechloris C2206]|uniref:Peptidoglycan binding-like domain-containing protein n=1 Tax=Halomicronema hongdechloris C2206 TaxID=1641165 RepID=A0A1Z3HP34_9CYAN|nr:peptidoglycan-binding domain-containing protein [Halomicronema hongdechloris]ASC72073.1 hypothetical protein XM38_030270 [Halomicronema hongdechloris C2206]